MHFGSGPTEEGDAVELDDCEDPFVVDEHLIELRECHKFSKSIFFIVSTKNYNFGVKMELINGIRAVMFIFRLSWARK